MSEWLKKKPEEAGIPSLWLYNMMNRWEEQLCHVHGYLMLKDGALVAEAYKYPYTKTSRRLLHSVSKTLTAIAVGFAVDEGRISVEDKVLSFFPDYNSQSEKYLSELTIYHLLTMSVGHSTDGIDSIFDERKSAWKAFLDLQLVHKPGTTFVYNSGATYMLSKILTLITREKILDYLTPRLFQPLDITDADWDEIDGANTGGWGCVLSLIDMAKIGQLLLQKGMWKGRRLISENWIEEMTGWKIPTEKVNVYQDWRQGYCYQMWRCSREGCFRADGAFGQYILVLPPKNMVVAIWCEDAFSQDMLNVFWEEVYDKIDERVYGIDGNAYEVYHRKCNEWSAPYQLIPTTSFRESFINNQTYTAFHGQNSMLESMYFFFSEDGHMRLVLKKNGIVSQIIAGNTGLYFGQDKMNFEIATFIRLGKKKEEVMKYAATYQWLSEDALKLHIYWLETAHATDITCVFGKNSLAASFSVSYGKFLNGAESTPALHISNQWFSGEIQEAQSNISEKSAKLFQAYPGMPVMK